MKKILILLLLTLPIQFLSPMKRSLGFEGFKGFVDTTKKKTLYERVYALLFKINHQAVTLIKDQETLYFNVALELNNELLVRDKKEKSNVEFCRAVKDLKITKTNLKILLNCCELDPMNTLKTSQVVSKYLKNA